VIVPVNIRTLLVAGTVLTLAAVLLVRSWLMFDALDASLEQYRVLAQRDDGLETTLARADGAVDILERGYLGFLATGDPVFQDSYEAASQELANTIAQLRPLSGNEDVAVAAIEKFDAEAELWDVVEGAQLRSRPAGELDPGILAGRLKTAQRQAGSLHTHLGELRAQVERQRQQEAEVFSALKQEFVRQSVVSGAIAFLVVCLVYLAIRQWVEVPLARLSAAAGALEHGAVAPVPLRGVTETRELGRIISALSGSLAAERARDARYRDFLVALARPKDLPSMAAAVVNALRRSYGVLAAAVWVTGADRRLRLVAAEGLSPDLRPDEPDPLARDVQASRRLTRLAHLDDAAAFTVHRAPDGPQPREIVAAPLLFADECIGVVELLLGTDAVIDPVELELLVERISRAVQLARTTEAIQADEQHTRLATLATALADPLLYADAGGVVQLANGAAARLGSVVGKPLTSVLAGVDWSTPDGTPPPPGETIAVLLESGGASYNLPRRFRDRDGHLRIVLASIVPVREGERTTGLVLSLHDVTAEFELRQGLEHANEELRAAYEELVRRQDELREQSRALTASREALAVHNVSLARASRTKSEVLATMSHELRTPLNAILGFTDAMLQDAFGAIPEEQRRPVADIHTAGRQLLLLINDVMDLSRAEAGVLPIDVTTVDLVEPVRQAVDLTAGVAVERGVTLSDRLSPGVLLATADRDRVRQVMLNVLSNAFKVAPEGGVVTIDGALRGEGVAVSVRTGSGGAADVPGMELGLAIARRLLVAMGGDLERDGAADATAFTITLPQATTRGAPVPSVPEVPTPLPDLATSGHALVLDATGFGRRVLASMLASEGFSVEDAADLDAALARAAAVRPAVIVVDLDGFPDALAPLTAVAPVVALGGPGEDAARARGCAGWVAKPVARATLRACIETAVSGAGRDSPKHHGIR
jgi:signal transduction histidine kinase/CHASE3 domain sensor protein